jgi:hypothetical protein
VFLSAFFSFYRGAYNIDNCAWYIVFYRNGSTILEIAIIPDAPSILNVGTLGMIKMRFCVKSQSK